MKILIATGIYPPATGGPATYAHTMAGFLTAAGHQVEILTYGGERTERSDKWKISVVPAAWPKPFRYAAFCLLALFKGWSCDVWLVLDTVSAGLPATAANLLARRRLVVKVVGDYAWEQGRGRYGVKENLDEFQNRTYGAPVERLRRLQSWMVRRASAIITPSHYLAGIVARWGIAKDKINVIYNAVDMPLAQAPIVPPPDSKLLVSAARLTPWKGMIELVEAFKSVVDRLPEARLAIIGAGPERDRIAAKISELGLGQAVQLVGAVPHVELPRWYAKARGFILNTSYEGMSHFLLEVMSAGLPLATTPAGGNVEIIRDGENGRLFPINDRAVMTVAMLELLQEQNRTSSWARHGLDMMRGWTRERMVEQTIKVLKSSV